MAKTLFQAMSIRDKLITVGITAITLLAFYNILQQGFVGTHVNDLSVERWFTFVVSMFFPFLLLGWLFYADRKYKRLKRNMSR